MYISFNNFKDAILQATDEFNKKCYLTEGRKGLPVKVAPYMMKLFPCTCTYYCSYFSKWFGEGRKLFSGVEVRYMCIFDRYIGMDRDGNYRTGLHKEAKSVIEELFSYIQRIDTTIDKYEELYKDLSSCKNDIEDTVKYSMEQLDRIDLGIDIDCFVYEYMNQIYMYISDSNKERIRYTCKKARMLSNKLHSHENCNNMKLPRSITKETGRDYTFTEWLSKLLYMYSMRLDIYIRYGN